MTDELLKIAEGIRDKFEADICRPYHYRYVHEKGHTESCAGSCYGAMSTGTRGYKYFIDRPWLKKLSSNGRIDGLSEKQKAYLKWWIEESFVSPYLLDRDWESVLRRGILFDCKYPGAFAVITGIGIRIATELSRTVDNWNTFKNFTEKSIAILPTMILNKYPMHKYYVASPSDYNWFINAAYKGHSKHIIHKKPFVLDNISSLSETGKYGPLSQIFGYNRTYTPSTQYEGYPLPGNDIRGVENSLGKKIKYSSYGMNRISEENLEKWIADFVDIHSKLYKDEG